MKCLLFLPSLAVPLRVHHSLRCLSFGTTTSFPPYRHDAQHRHRVTPFSSFRHRRYNNNNASRVRTTRLAASSSFQPPTPPESHGHPVFPDIQIKDTTTTKPQQQEEDGTSATIRNKDPNAVFVVNGSSRGIGLQFVKSLLHRTNGRIVACCRSPMSALELQKLVASSSSSSSSSQYYSQRIRIMPLDMEDQSTIDTFAETMHTEYRRIDGLFNVAGILGDGLDTSGPERTFAAIERDWLEKSFNVNVIGPVMLIKAVAPLMRSTGRKSIVVVREDDRKDGEGEIKIDLPKGRPPTIVVNLSARVGSISDNRLGGWYSYRMSKSALNQATKTLGLELKRQGTWILALHPGTTDTDLSKPFQKNVQKERLFPVDFTVNSLLDVIDSMGDEHTGGYFDWAGKAIPF